MTSAAFTPGTLSELHKALAGARPGAVIYLLDADWRNALTASANGTADKPIILRGTADAVLTSGGKSSGIGLKITGDYWRVEGISVDTAQRGISVEGSTGTVLDGVHVLNSGYAGVQFSKGSRGGAIRNSVIRNAGIDGAMRGAGVLVGMAGRDWERYNGSQIDITTGIAIQNNLIEDTTAEGVDLREGSFGGTVSGNTFVNTGRMRSVQDESGAYSVATWVDVKGQGYTITGNHGPAPAATPFKTRTLTWPKRLKRDRPVVPGSGNDNLFASNSVDGGFGGSMYVWEGGSNNTVRD
nr:right-handed parallel beta-helix repeat-containing protein [Motilibacter deserti]